MRPERSPFFWLAFAAVGLVWGSSWIASDILTEYVPPLRASALRYLLAALLCLPVILFRRTRLPRGRALGVSLVLPVTMVVLPALLLRWVQLPSATVAVLFAAMPLVLAFAAPRAALQASIVAWGAMAYGLGISFSFSFAQAGAAVIVLAVVASIAASTLAIRRELSQESPVMVTALLLGTAGGLLFLASLALERGLAVEWTRDAVVSLVFLGAVSGAGAYATYVWLLQRMEAYQAATLQWTGPLLAVLESALFLRLRPGFSMITGTIVTLVCLGVVMRARPEDDESVSLLGN